MGGKKFPVETGQPKISVTEEQAESAKTQSSKSDAGDAIPATTHCRFSVLGSTGGSHGRCSVLTVLVPGGDGQLVRSGECL